MFVCVCALVPRAGHIRENTELGAYEILCFLLNIALAQHGVCTTARSIPRLLASRPGGEVNNPLAVIAAVPLVLWENVKNK